MSLQRGFTLIELLVVIAIIGILSAMVLNTVGSAKGSAVRKRVESQLAELITSIEGYRQEVGFYPPDNIVFNNDGTVQERYPHLNTLYYELTGMIAHHEENHFDLPGVESDETAVEPDVLLDVFNADGFANVADTPKGLRYKNDDGFTERDYATLEELGGSEAERRLRVLVVPGDWKNFTGQDGRTWVNPLGDNVRINTWRYVSTYPTNNVDSYDLWAEVVLNDEILIIGNWDE